ncbi:MAG: response regulator [Candidatus Omnitrophica bacterium]|nr:response regulator [Candidatus Omnitrophota bacterium]MCM8822539.1 response regulator [Candidatus Omnitrophota bacterium]MCM8824726.1 response regulator [Candidatus Omnitrophota bacterium]MCM8827957.1 response regulator [Candidatus Omnitrophota bacterium]
MSDTQAVKTILVAEDDPETRLILQQGLTRAGYYVVLAEDGEQALERFRQFKPDLVLLDIEMPRFNGWEVLERLKSGWRSRRVPVIMITGKTSDEDKIKGYSLGVDYYVTKPFNIQRILPIIRNLVSGTK